MEKRKIYLLDTTVLIENPDIMYELGDADVIIPLAVIKEMDGLKNNTENIVAQAARKVGREIDRLGSYGDLLNGIKLSSEPVLKIYTGYDDVDGLISEQDNRIVGAAAKIQRETGKKVILLTTDINMRTVARAYGINAEPPYGLEASTLSAGSELNSGVLKLLPDKSNKMKGIKMKSGNKKRNRAFIYFKAFNKYLLPKKLKIFLALFLIIGGLFYFFSKAGIVGSLMAAFVIAAFLKMAFPLESRTREDDDCLNIYSSPECSFIEGNIYHSSNDDR